MTRIYDNLMSEATCLHSNGDNRGRLPDIVRWRFDGPPGPNAWFTDGNLFQARQINAECKIAWILEPRELRSDPYDFVEKHYEDFDFILTHDKEFLLTPGSLFYWFGGTRIAPDDWGIREKTRDVSIVASPKRSMPGHRLRHEIIESCSLGVIKTEMHAYGPEYRPLSRKLHALAPYQFTVAIENSRKDWWFTEALIDPLLTGTVPIYWGCPGIGEFFDGRGIIQVKNLDEALEAIVGASLSEYRAMLPYVKANFKLAQSYHMTENWLQETYPHIFDETHED